MVDFQKATGAGGTMLIRDTGSVVEFWITANEWSSYNAAMPWKYTVNGTASNWLSYNYPANAGWRRLGYWNVTTDQTVTFYLGDTGTTGLGGPTTLSAAIKRSSVPGKPKPWTIKTINNTSVYGESLNAPNGGFAISRSEVGYGTSSAGPTYFYNIGTNGAGTIGSLAQNTTYYFWVRNYNTKGVGPWSDRTTARTLSVPPAPGRPTITKIRNTVVHSLYSGNGNGGSAITSWQTGYGTNPTAPTTVLTGYDIEIPNLVPGTKYYIFGRGSNKFGTGPWGPYATVQMPSGGWVFNVSGVPKRAVPYVRVNGVWKPAEARIKIAGLWKPGG